MTTNNTTNAAPSPEPEPTEDEDLVLGVGPEVDVADGAYPGTLTNLEPFTAERDGEQISLIRWTFVVETDDGPVEVQGVSSKARGPRAKSVAWLTALMGKDAKPGTNFRKAELLGRECLVVVEHDDNGFPRVANVVAAPTKKTTKAA